MGKELGPSDKRRAGRAGKYEYWRTGDGLTQLRGYARRGMNDEQIAAKIGIAPSTLYEWKKKYPEISEALKEGKDLPDIQVEAALYQAALGGNVTAMIFWLKNRLPNSWRDKPEPTGDSEALKAAKALLGGIDSAIN